MATTDNATTGSPVALSASYQDASGWVQVANSGWITFLLNWTKGDETSIQAAIDLSAGGVTVRLPCENWSAGTSTSVPAVWSFAAASWPSLNPAVSARVGAPLARLLVKATGGTPTGTVTATWQEADNT